MTDQDWLNSTDPQAMLAFLRAAGKLSERKARLFAVAVCRRIWHLLTDERSRRAVDVADMYADGMATAGEMAATRASAESVVGPGRTAARAAARVAVADAAYAAWCAHRCAAWSVCKHLLNPRQEQALVLNLRKEQALVLCDIFGDPFRQPPALDSAWLMPHVMALAQAAYYDRLLPSGHLDPARLAELGIALEVAGCTDVELLGHLRGRVPHVRGCWAADLLLGQV